MSSLDCPNIRKFPLVLLHYPLLHRRRDRLVSFSQDVNRRNGKGPRFVLVVWIMLGREVVKDRLGSDVGAEWRKEGFHEVAGIRETRVESDVVPSSDDRALTRQRQRDTLGRSISVFRIERWRLTNSNSSSLGLPCDQVCESQYSAFCLAVHPFFACGTQVAYIIPITLPPLSSTSSLSVLDNSSIAAGPGFEPYE